MFSTATKAVNKLILFSKTYPLFVFILMRQPEVLQKALHLCHVLLIVNAKVLHVIRGGPDLLPNLHAPALPQVNQLANPPCGGHLVVEGVEEERRKLAGLEHLGDREVLGEGERQQQEVVADHRRLNEELKRTRGGGCHGGASRGVLEEGHRVEDQASKGVSKLFSVWSLIGQIRD